MDNTIKLIWDFKGPNAHKTAIHHEIHLKEYVLNKQLKLDITGVSQLNEMHCIAFLVVEKSEMITVRDSLRPHRGQVWEDNSK